MPQVKLLVWIWPAHETWLVPREKKEIGPWRWRLVDKKNKEGRGSRLEDLCHCFSNVMSLLVIHNYRPMSGMGAIQRSAGSEWGAKWRPVGGQTPGGWVSHEIATFWWGSDPEKCTQTSSFTGGRKSSSCSGGKTGWSSGNIFTFGL